MIPTHSPSLSRRTVLGAATATVLGMAGCRSGDGGNGSPTGSQPAQRPSYIPYDGPQPELPGNESGLPNGFLRYPDPPPSTGRVPLGLSAPVEMLCQGRTSSTPMDRNRWWQQWNQDLGAEFRVQPVASQYMDRFQTAVAGDALSDLTQIYSSSPRLPELLESRFTDLTPFLSGDKVADYPNLANLPPDSWDVGTIGGRIYGFTQPRIIVGSTILTHGGVLESLGIDQMPELSDGDDFLALCREVTDPASDRYAFGQIPQDWTIPAILEALGGPNEWRINEDGTWTSMYETDEYARALDIVTRMYREQLFHPNSYSTGGNADVVSGWFEAGTTVMWAQGFNVWQNRIGSTDFPIGAVVMPRWDEGGAAPKHFGPPGYEDPVGIKKMDDEKRIDELLRVVDYIASPFGSREYLNVNEGVADRHYRIEDGQIVPIPDAPSERLFGPTYAAGNGVINLYVPGSPESTKVLYEHCQKVIPDGVRNPRHGRFSETAVTQSTGANRKLQDVQASIIQGRDDISTWPSAVAEWKRAAGDAMAREYAEQ